MQTTQTERGWRLKTKRTPSNGRHSFPSRQSFISSSFSSSSSSSSILMWRTCTSFVHRSPTSISLRSVPINSVSPSTAAQTFIPSLCEGTFIGCSLASPISYASFPSAKPTNTPVCVITNHQSPFISTPTTLTFFCLELRHRRLSSSACSDEYSTKIVVSDFFITHTNRLVEGFERAN